MVTIGNRGNIKIGKIYFYTHWGGSELYDYVRNALDRGRERWTDEPYLARIIFCEMVGDDVKGTTGFGISTEICDNEHNILEVDVKNQKVIVHLMDSDTVISELSFDQFVENSKMIELRCKIEGDD